ncbi:MAG: AAA family ATPase [Rikenellaceae bacterium]|jgi:shikimate kinase|nr:AAA family ATPase [Rikenellaceae bacterium]
MVGKIFLTGFMGSGKSSFGRRLAARLGRDFVDTDREIERIAEASILEIFATRGEEWFRELESEVIEGLKELNDNTVVALGGGAACREGVVERLRGQGTVVYLKMSPERLVRQIGQKGRDKRPKISGMNDEQLLSYINKTLPEREIFYNKANFVVDCEAVSDERIVELLAGQISL